MRACRFLLQCEAGFDGIRRRGEARGANAQAEISARMPFSGREE
jgi:hypothetical protein